MIDMTTLVVALIGVMGAVMAVHLIPWIKANTTEKQRKDLLAWTEIGVRAAEQMIIGGGKGAKKLQYVLDFLKGKGFDVDLQEVRMAIEAAVKDMNQFEVVAESVSIGGGETE